MTEVGFLADLYPNQPCGWIPLIDAQELHGSWQRHIKGMPFPVLGHPLHPWYGVYAPTRSEHLELFSTWLRGDAGERRSAVDVGTGCGVLALLLRRAGFAAVTATDINPNALVSGEELQRHG